MAQLTIQQAFDLAMQHHKAGRVGQAEELYRQILVQQPRHVDALHLLGVVAHQAGKNDIAVGLMRQAIALKPNYAEAHFNLGIALRDKGQLEEAIAAFGQAVALQPNDAETHLNLGIALWDKGQLDQAIVAYRRAIVLRPEYAVAYNNLGNALQKKKNLEEAIVAYQQAIVVKPDYAEAYSNLGTALQEKGMLPEAIAAYRRAIALRPDNAEAFSNLGNGLMAVGQLDEAIAAHEQAIALKPNEAIAHYNLGTALQKKGKLDEAIAAYGRAIAIRPDLPQAHSNLGSALREKGQVDEAIAACRRAIALKPEFAEAHMNLCNALRSKGQLDEAFGACRQAIALKPNYAEAYTNLGNVLKDMGCLEEAIAAYRQVIAIKPGFHEGHSNLIYTAYFHPDYDPPRLLNEARQWAERHARSIPRTVRHDNDRDGERRLKVGYVSADFREHPVGRFLLPLLANHNPHNLEVHCYAGVRNSDGLTQRLRQASHVWHDASAWDDGQLAEQVRGDGIDILVDLTLHMGNGRLLAFAGKPAPVQVCWLAYPGTTGLRAIDYRLSDPYLDPPGMDESIYSERTVRLAHCYWCYPQPDDSPPVGRLPALDGGVVTFGCFNNFCKISAATIQCWIELMKALPNSRLLIHSKQGEHRQRFSGTFAVAGIDPSRLRFSGGVPMRQYFQQYNEVDIALDPFPYGGGTTTCDALWMGVPAITLCGDRAVGRLGVTLLSNVGLKEWIAHSTSQYVAFARKWAGDLAALAGVRQELRQWMLGSPLMDGKRFAADVETAYRQMWQTYCAANELER